MRVLSDTRTEVDFQLLSLLYVSNRRLRHNYRLSLGTKFQHRQNLLTVRMLVPVVGGDLLVNAVGLTLGWLLRGWAQGATCDEPRLLAHVHVSVGCVLRLARLS